MYGVKPNMSRVLESLLTSGDVRLGFVSRDLQSFQGHPKGHLPIDHGNLCCSSSLFSTRSILKSRVTG
jgi:hypothetical protein